ncbi:MULTISPECIES: outer membrane usher protein [Pseudomonas]|jgi:outer membrane usher protein PapC|uniref:Outer membrane usher protein n=1 Tax=Pseudomonas asgharzadehiana TaxID=2842349 RepID=A0ABX8NWV9_9PSED|nr:MULTISPECIES: outer membrane usher protein [Pseudomonas]CRM92502.1 Outer membrane usher protein PapC precursor [Pseudomonas sp. 22 E 5]MCX9149534.1 outer membrane usher protein [Pseudomonas sp. TB1-B1]QXH65862.1 outer membrane usher protein [Pseudomonas asgharzadehiana]CRM01991.1 Outer membrane usher protein PapC precursor [Pseudomonas sp. 31 E 6]CRM32274.1 Outer membrane usher protein PapC precursor [Pseudomonas sp. 31 E 5]
MLNTLKVRHTFAPSVLGGLMSLAGTALGAGDIEFNTDVLDLSDRSNIDLSRFAHSGFILPGTYSMVVQVNAQPVSEQSVTFYPPDDDPKGSQACLSPALVGQLGLKATQAAGLASWRGGECLDLKGLPGTQVSADLATSRLNISLPQAYLQYSAINWDPPSRWDEGVPGLLVDYNLTAQSIFQRNDGQRKNLSGNGTVGANAGAWRLRADWQGRVENGRESAAGPQKLEWSRYYAYRAVPSLSARLLVGENYLYSDLFDSFRFTGAALNSDESQLPPNLRGYAPEVVGVAKTNAKVIVSQQGRVLYETLVAAGPFRIQDLNDAVSGTLDVRVEEQDGSVHTFKIDTAGVPYLTRPGQVRYKLASGRPTRLQHGAEGKTFATGEFSWGISNGWSLFGGGITDSNYRAMSVGAGRDLLAFGAVSLDVTQSRARVWNESLSGKSLRLQYSKNFEAYDSQVTFAGYRFSQENFLSMSEYLDARYYGLNGERGSRDEYVEGRDSWKPLGASKALYTVTLNKQFRDLGATVYASYNKQTYWNRSDTQRWNLAVSRYFNVGTIKNMSLSLNMYRSEDYNYKGNGMSLMVSLPLGRTGTLSLDANSGSGKNPLAARYSDRLDERNSYQIGASNQSASGYLSHMGDAADIDLSASTQKGSYSSLGVSARGGGTLTPYGAALHRTQSTGGTRLMIDTAGVPDVPVRGYGSPTRSNAFGKAVIADIGSYQRTSASVDLERLPANVEATQSVTQLTLTEGAIGYRSLEVISGEKAMAVLRLPDSSAPPFGATVKNLRQQDTGIVNDDGHVYLSGIQAGERMIVSWGGAERCTVTLPTILPMDGLTDALNLRCQLLAADQSSTDPAALTGTPIDTENTSS